MSSATFKSIHKTAMFWCSHWVHHWSVLLGSSLRAIYTTSFSLVKLDTVFHEFDSSGSCVKSWPPITPTQPFPPTSAASQYSNPRHCVTGNCVSLPPGPTWNLWTCPAYPQDVHRPSPLSFWFLATRSKPLPSLAFYILCIEKSENVQVSEITR